MLAEIRNKPDFASVHLVLGASEQVITEPGAMMGMHPGLKLESNLKGGLLAAASRALLGESVILNTYTATADGQRLDLAPAQPGDVEAVALDGSTSLILQKGGFLASTPGISLEAKFDGAKGWFAGESVLMIRATGAGTIWISSYGAISQVDVNGEYDVDTGHLVAFDDTLRWNLQRVGGLKASLLSGEGVVCRFSGRGRLWFQTRSPSALASFLNPFRKIKPKSNN